MVVPEINLSLPYEDERTRKIKAIGRRKRAIAHVELLPNGNGNIVVNGRDILEYMQLNIKTVSNIQDPLEVLGLEKKYDAFIKVSGGGIIGQAQAIRLGISRALCGHHVQLLW